jgi:hypothetical protein
MAERTTIVCDICGEPATQSVTFRVGNRSLSQDLCPAHLQELVQRSHTPRRGRRPGSVAKVATAKRTGPRKAVSPPRPRRRTTERARKASSAGAKTRKRITDPETLQKRQAAMAKAREALASKRAAQKAE